MFRTNVGQVHVISVNDAQMAFPAANVYPAAGSALDAFRDFLDDSGAVPLPFQSFVLLDGDETILVDTGFGPDQSGQLPQELEASGIAPQAVTRVVFTHLHGDHIGWNIDRDTGEALFPNARYQIPREDWEHFGSSGEDQAFERMVRPLEAMGQCELFDGETPLTESIRTLPTPGHTPGHTAILIDSDGERGCVLGDVVLTPIDAANPELENSFDTDSALARTTREQMLQRLTDEAALVGASHMPVPGVGRFVLSAGKRSWRGV